MEALDVLIIAVGALGYIFVSNKIRANKTTKADQAVNDLTNKIDAERDKLNDAQSIADAAIKAYKDATNKEQGGN